MKQVKQFFIAVMIIGITAPSFVIAQSQSHRPPYHRMKNQIEKAEEKLDAAENSTGERRQRMMSEHMEMMGQALDEMEDMKPAEKMTPEERTEWINEHQKMMRNMMGQMKRQHEMMQGEHKMMEKHHKKRKGMSKDDS